MKNLAPAANSDRLSIMGEYPIVRSDMSPKNINENRIAFKTQNLFVLKVHPTNSNAQGLTQFGNELAPRRK